MVSKVDLDFRTIKVIFAGLANLRNHPRNLGVKGRPVGGGLFQPVQPLSAPRGHFWFCREKALRCLSRSGADLRLWAFLARCRCWREVGN